MRKKIVAGNWKMNLTYEEGIQLTKDILDTLGQLGDDISVILIPPFVHLKGVAELVQNTALQVGAQSCHAESCGAFTGEVSAAMIRSTGADYVLVGHSERRQYFNEDNALLAQKVNIALENGLVPVYCCGETLEQREQGRHFQIIEQQITEGVFHLSADQFKNIVIAYEPVWAIGTGKTASPEQAQEIHAFIRQLVSKKYGAPMADSISILYGGSCKPDNAAELFSQKDIDGGLIGGASLKAQSFAEIIESL